MLYEGRHHGVEEGRRVAFNTLLEMPTPLYIRLTCPYLWVFQYSIRDAGRGQVAGARRRQAVPFNTLLEMLRSSTQWGPPTKCTATFNTLLEMRRSWPSR